MDPSKQFEKNMKKYLFGIDIGGTTVKIGLFDLNGRLLEKREISTRTEALGKYILSDIAESAEKLLSSQNTDWSSAAGIGIDVPGPVIGNHYVTRCVNLGWKDIDVSKEMRVLTGVEDIIVVNDAKSAALGEWWMGGHNNCRSAVMITLGTGIGGGVILDGRIVNGAFGGAGELSHFPIVPDETEPCACGKYGHLQQYASAEGIVHQFQKKLRSNKNLPVLSDNDHITAKDIIDAARSGDEPAKKIVDDAVKKIAQTMAMITSVIDPELFLIGGGMAEAGDFLLNAIHEEFRRLVLFVSENARVELAVMGNEAGIYGAVKSIMNCLKDKNTQY